MKAEPLKIQLAGGDTVSGLWLSPSRPTACLVLAHGAGAGMEHRSMAAIAEGLEALGIATLRFQFPDMEKGSRRPDPACHCTARLGAQGSGGVFREHARTHRDSLPV